MSKKPVDLYQSVRVKNMFKVKSHNRLAMGGPGGPKGTGPGIKGDSWSKKKGKKRKGKKVADNDADDMSMKKKRKSAKRKGGKKMC